MYGVRPFNPEPSLLTIALRYRSRVYICIITVKFLVWENTTRKELHPLEFTSKVTTEFAYNGTSSGLHKERYCRIDVISELKCMLKMPSGPNKMQRYRRMDVTDDSIANKRKVSFRANCSAPPVKCLPVRLWLAPNIRHSSTHVRLHLQWRLRVSGLVYI